MDSALPPPAGVSDLLRPAVVSDVELKGSTLPWSSSHYGRPPSRATVAPPRVTVAPRVALRSPPESRYGRPVASRLPLRITVAPSYHGRPFPLSLPTRNAFCTHGLMVFITFTLTGSVSGVPPLSLPTRSALTKELTLSITFTLTFEADVQSPLPCHSHNSRQPTISRYGSPPRSHGRYSTSRGYYPSPSPLARHRRPSPGIVAPRPASSPLVRHHRPSPVTPNTQSVD